MIRKHVSRDGIVICPICQKKYKVSFRDVHYPGAGSAADWLTISLPCSHESEEFYDDNRASVEMVVEV